MNKVYSERVKSGGVKNSFGIRTGNGLLENANKISKDVL